MTLYGSEPMQIKPSLVGFAFAFGLVAGAAQAQTVNFTAELSGAQEVPAVAGAGKGMAMASLNTATDTLSWEVSYSGLSGNALAGHIHGPAATGANAPVLVPFTAPLASPIKGSAKLTPAQVKELEAGQMYVNIHTAEHKAGEIRGQLTPAK
ncbi:MAG TPA: CHRD domain-containing protein [Stellaceae bacterium]|nr:CHRD domain-containing protein [Stellaceae bacterium]